MKLGKPYLKIWVISTPAVKWESETLIFHPSFIPSSTEVVFLPHSRWCWKLRELWCYWDPPKLHSIFFYKKVCGADWIVPYGNLLGGQKRKGDFFNDYERLKRQWVKSSLEMRRLNLFELLGNFSKQLNGTEWYSGVVQKLCKNVS